MEKKAWHIRPYSPNAHKSGRGGEEMLHWAPQAEITDGLSGDNRWVTATTHRLQSQAQKLLSQ